MSNPYTLVFGQSPYEMIDRSAQRERIISEFTAGRPSNYLNLVTGIRGSGKTVFITQVAKQLSARKDWIVVNLNSQRDLLEVLAAKLCSDQNAIRWIREAKINLQAFGFGMEIQGEPPIVDIEVALVKILTTIKKKKKRILITIDEASNTKDMRVFASSYQLFLREELPVFLLLSGLYKSIDSLRNANGMTFLERAPRTILSPLDINAIVANYEKNLMIAQDKAIRLANATKGYSFAFQVYGYFSWENAKNLEKAYADSKDYLYEFAYKKIWSELSPKDRKVVCAMAKAHSSEVAEIREILGFSSNQFNPYRDRLLKAGVVASPQSGILEFALPLFAEYANERGEYR